MRLEAEITSVGNVILRLVSSARSPSSENQDDLVEHILEFNKLTSTSKADVSGEP